MGLSLLLSVFQARYRDVVQIWEVLLQAGFFLTPIFYPMSIIPEKYYFYIYLNPISGIVQFARMALLEQHLLDLKVLAYTVGCVLMTFVFGFIVFKYLSRNVAEKL